MTRLALARHLILEGQWSTARALASGCAVSVEYVRQHARRTPHVETDDCDDGDRFAYGGGFGYGDNTDVYYYTYGNKGDGFGGGEGLGDEWPPNDAYTCTGDGLTNGCLYNFGDFFGDGDGDGGDQEGDGDGTNDNQGDGDGIGDGFDDHDRSW